MKKLFLSLMTFAMLCGFAAEKLAIAEPVGSGVTKDELQNFWSLLEVNAGGSKYELVTRSALQSMLTEIGLTENSVLTDLNSTQRAKIGKLKTVKYILTSRISKTPGRYTAALMLLDASTGEIAPNCRASETAADFNELSDKLKNMLRLIGIGPAVLKYGRSAVLDSVVQEKNYPAFLISEIGINLENTLLNNGVRLQNLQSVKAILSRNGIGDLSAAEPAMYARIGDLLQVDFLIQPYVTRFTVRVEKRYIAVSRTNSTRYMGDISGFIRIISAQTGTLYGSVPFEAKVDFSNLDLDTTDWAPEDFGRYLIRVAIPQACKQAAVMLTGQPAK